MAIHTLLIKLTVDDEKFDLRPYIDEAVAIGWGDDPENGMCQLADEIASDYWTTGCNLEWVV